MLKEFSRYAIPDEQTHSGALSPAQESLEKREYIQAFSPDVSDCNADQEFSGVDSCFENAPAPVVPPTDSGYASVSRMGIERDSLRKHDDQAAARSAQDLTNSDVEDTATEYSTMSSTNSSKKQQYIRNLADDLLNKISWLKVDKKTQTEVLAILPELLQAFALKLGHDAPTQMNRDIMAFIHKHRR